MICSLPVETDPGDGDEKRQDEPECRLCKLDFLSLIFVLPIVPSLFPAVRDGGHSDHVERKHHVPAEHGPLAVVQSQGFLERIFELDILEGFLLLLWSQHNLCGSVTSNSGLRLLLLLRWFQSTF